MIRRIISIDEFLCNGCGLCANACHEGAIGIVDGKARLLRENYCDGLGDCLPSCPTGAISFVEREAPAYDEAAVLASKRRKEVTSSAIIPSQLQNWPIQIKLSPVQSAYFQDADLLIAADCTAFSYGNFHQDFMIGKTVLIGCPKLDAVDYSQKLTAILQHNPIRSITVTRMTVPCCGGLPFAVQKAISASGKEIPLRVVTISPDGQIVA